MRKSCSCATLTNVSYCNGSVSSVLGLLAPSIYTRILYKPPLSKIGPVIDVLLFPKAYRAPGALACSEPP